MACFFLASFPAGSGSVSGLQAGPLGEVDQLVRAGQIQRARSVLQRWWEEGRDEATRLDLQRGFWLRGTLTVDASIALRDYRRLAVEYPGGPFSDRALGRLAQAADEVGQLAEAAAHYNAILRDYPSSQLRLDAQTWLEMRGGEVDRALAEVEAERRTAVRQVETPPQADPNADGASREPGVSGESDESGAFAVQLGAFSSEARALRLAQELRGRGRDVRLVRIPGSGLIRVRLGRFSEEEAASRLMRDLLSLGFEAAVVRDVPREEPFA